MNAELYIRNVFLSPNPVDAGTLFLISVDVLVLFPEETVHRLPFGLGGQGEYPISQIIQLFPNYHLN